MAQNSAQEISLRLCNFLVEEILDPDFRQDGGRCEPQTLFADLGIDSIAIMELVFFLERSYQCKLPPEVLSPEHLRCAESLAEFTAAIWEQQTSPEEK